MTMCYECFNYVQSDHHINREMEKVRDMYQKSRLETQKYCVFWTSILGSYEAQMCSHGIFPM